MCLVSKLWQAAVLLVLGSFAHGLSLTPLTEEELSDVVGQHSLFVTDVIGPQELSIGDMPAGEVFNDFTFYRMGLDARLDLNMNLSKLQLGCGGINDALSGGPGCDLDIDYLRFMGINAAGDRPSEEGPDSHFEMIRPYFELAIKNDDSPAHREVAGLKIGAQRINGALSIGRVADELGHNIDTGMHCDPSATTGVQGCHSGVNSLSGGITMELSAGFKARANIMGFITTDIDGCFGRIDFASCQTTDTPFFVESSGTRLGTLHVAAANLKIANIDLGCNIFNFLVCNPAQLFANLLVDEGYGQLELDTRLIHYLVAPDTADFFLSFQREPVSWPNYSKTAPANDVPFDMCNPAYGQASARCSSAYATAMSTGWSLYAPGVKMLNIQPDQRINVGHLSAGSLLSSLGAEGKLHIDNPKLDMLPVSNCYGSAQFC